MDRTLSAPGKLFLAGEYAVLWGGVGRVLAVGSRARAFVRRRADRRVELLLDDGRLSGDTTPLGARWVSTPTAAFHFVARTVDLALRAVAQDAPGFSIAFEPSPLVQGQKLGFGSSARACVLAAEACRTAMGASFDALKLALVAHASAQGGKGSGADVAACFAGDVVRYRRADVGPLIEAANRGGFGGALRAAPPVDVWRVSAPRLPMAYVFAGASASTPALISEVERTLAGKDRERFVLQSDALGLSLEETLTRGDFSGTRAATEALQALLFSLGPTRTEGLERVLALAAATGCVAKQSGAGGGDGCLVFAPDVATRDAALASFAARGLFATPVAAEPGLRGEAQPAPELVRWVDAAD
ncbi:MAG: phosphomevalonate kinase [Myxococcaceae bacterium]|nr:phosphomevalonate kinase [Myxococcaceae bacterium]MCA3016501.1 phosphomevalonate kinase [Myxococcaceae bacterium]